MKDERRKQMADAKAKYLSGDDLIAALAGETIDHEVVVNGKPAGVIQIRSLEFETAQREIMRFQKDLGGLMLWTLDNGIVEPVLNDAQRETIRRGKPGPLMAVAEHIMQISGMTDSEGASPLAGTASPPETVPM